jgi:hypothetical protein
VKQAPLVSRIALELTQIQVMTDQTKRMLEKVESTGDLDYLGTVALNLQSFYTAVERIFIAIAKEIDTTVPKQENWHQALLEQMTVEIPRTRQAVLAIETFQGLDEFRRFRHVVRSNYAHQLDPNKVQELARKLDGISQNVIKDCQQFCSKVKSRDGDEDIREVT